jgi:hypothetical protein
MKRPFLVAAVLLGLSLAGKAEEPFANVRVRLFAQVAEGDCCSPTNPVAETVTSRTGSFHFKKVAMGDYWLVATISGVEYKILVRYKPDQESESACSDLLYSLDDGHLQLRRSVTVTVT